MDKDPIQTNSLSGTRRMPHIVSKPSRNEEGRIDCSRARGKIWLGVAVIALLGCCVVGLVKSKRQTSAIQRPSPGQEHIAALAKQISSLMQTDLIVFPDGRVWYVRSVRGKNLEVVGWVGDNARSEEIDSFVLREDQVKIVRHDESAWPAERDRFLTQ